MYKRPMHYAAEYNQPDVIQWLYDKGHDINQVTIPSGAPNPRLIYANVRSKSEGSHDDNQITPAHFAAQEGSLRALQKLKELDADVYYKEAFDELFSGHDDFNYDYKKSPIYYAVKYDQYNILEWYLDNGVPSMMHIAALCANLSLMEWLKREKNIDYTTADEFDNTNIHSLLLGNHLNQEDKLLEVIQWLVKERVNINATNDKGTTALHLIAKKNYFKLAEWFIENGAKQVEDHKGETPMDLAIRGGELNLMQLFKDNGGYVKANSFYLYMNNPNCDRSLELCKWLKNNGANINLPGELDGLTPLHLALKQSSLYSYQSLEICKWFKDNGANINLPGGVDGLTPLHLAVKQSDLRAVEWLLSNGADVDIKDLHRKTTIEMAVSALVAKQQNNLRYSDDASDDKVCNADIIISLLCHYEGQLKEAPPSVWNCISDNIVRIVNIEFNGSQNLAQGVFNIFNISSNREGEKAAELSVDLLSVLEEGLKDRAPSKIETYEELNESKPKIENAFDMQDKLEGLNVLFSWPEKKGKLKGDNKFTGRFKEIIDELSILKKYKHDLEKYIFQSFSDKWQGKDLTCIVRKELFTHILTFLNSDLFSHILIFLDKDEKLSLFQDEKLANQSDKLSPHLVDIDAQNEDMPPTKIFKADHTSLMGEGPF
ncbi:hypothetical protein phytr_5180 [Candidatus Phycorickettsia trachydisci]|uniref:Ankyrin repeat protein n=1 Tax=Candidatus Phycorickettsia trachydisci TaxID=2115978 RepID=A0A2P1P883_9RICK|nr:ankyrin repeat domain-containing protein [Candidatus Phycorickettsia trachydisci]AVP87464.1 hypothetical protein phytr_5180 [Candidatus Phycorickettsia trachydisci]